MTPYVTDGRGFRPRHLLAAVALSAAGMWTAVALTLRWLFRHDVGEAS